MLASNDLKGAHYQMECPYHMGENYAMELTLQLSYKGMQQCQVDTTFIQLHE